MSAPHLSVSRFAIVAAVLSTAATLATACSRASVSPGAARVAVNSPASRAFAILRRARTTGDRLPETADANQYLRDNGLPARNSRLARRDAGRGLWLIAGSRRACLYFGTRYGGYTCGAITKLLDGRLALSAYMDEGLTTIARFLPDGIRNVTVDVPRRPLRTVQVRDNSALFHVSGSDPVGHVSWTTSDGIEHREPLS